MSNDSRPALSGAALRQAIREVVGRFLDPQQFSVFIFGSESSGTADRCSDIDLGILGPAPVPGAVIQRIRDELETLRTLRAFDVVDLSQVDESFKTKALSHAEQL